MSGGLRLQGLLLCVAGVWAAALHVVGYECNYNSSDSIRPAVREFGPIVSVNYPGGYGAYQSSCQLHTEACHGCTIKVHFEEAALAKCTSESVFKSTSGSCDTKDQCEYFIWTEEGRPSRRLVGNLTGRVVRAEGPVTLTFCYSGRPELARPGGYRSLHRWKAVFTVLDQFTYRVYGSAQQSGPNPAPSTGILRSPGFPLLYPENHTTYFIQGIVPTDRIRIVFDDFDIDPIASRLEIYDGPGRTSSPGRTYRDRDERPVFTSTSEYVLIEFFPGGRANQPFMGFKATYDFIPKDSISELPNPVHHKCAAVRPSSGGVVLQVGPSPGSAPVYHDCVWSLPVPPNLYMSVHIIQFTLSEVPFSRFPLLRQLEIRNAFHSDGKVLTILYSESQLPLPLGEGYLSSRGGLYVRLRATLSNDSIVRFSYTPYREEPQPSNALAGASCYLKRGVDGVQPGVFCESTRSLWCIPAKLACDNFSHCPSAADEKPPVCPGARAAAETPVTPTEVPTVTRTAACPAPMYRCSNGRCVKRRSDCYPTGYMCADKGMDMCDNNIHRCYRREQRCDKINDCGDWSDERDCPDLPDHRLSVFVQSLGSTWFFFLPAGILILTFVVGCVIYKTRKFRRLANGEGYMGAAPSDDVQLHTFTATAPPPYEEIVPSAATTDGPANRLPEREPPPPYEEIAKELCSVSQDGAGAAAPSVQTYHAPSVGPYHLQVTGAGSPAASLLYRVGGPGLDGAAAAAGELEGAMVISEA